MITPKSKFKLTIPEWENKVFAGVVIPTYYTKKDKIPAKHKGAILKKLGNTAYYVDSEGKKLIKNSVSVGNRKYLRPNGQSLYNGSMHWSERNTLVRYYHRYFKKFISPIFKEQFPIFRTYSLSMKVIFYEIIDNKLPDITNQWLIVKIIEDVFKELKVLIDDSPEFRRKSSFEYRFVEKEEDRKLIIKFKYKKHHEQKIKSKVDRE